MGGIALIMGCARVIGSVLTNGHIIHTIAFHAPNIIGNFGLAMAGIGILIFTLTPLSGPLVGSLDLAKVGYTKWVRYAAPLMGILTLVSAIFVSILAAMQWVG